MAGSKSRVGFALNVEVARVAASVLGLFFCKPLVTGQSSAVPVEHRPGYNVGCRFFQPVAATRRGCPGPAQRCHQHNHAPGTSTRATHCRERQESRPGSITSFFIRVLMRQPWQSSFKSSSLIATIRSYASAPIR